MHLLTAHIDDLTAGVAGPIDRLVSVALQASRTGGMAKDYLMNQFEEKAAFTKSQLEVVRYLDAQIRMGYSHDHILSVY